MSHRDDETPPAETDAETGDGERLEFAGTVGIDANKDELWSVISDPEVLTTCIPGAESVERVSERKYTCEITRGVSKLTVSLSGEAEFVEMNPPDYVVAAGSAFDSKTGSDFDVLAAMEMTEADDGTVELTYTAEVEFTGGAASLSAGLLRPVVRRDVDTYFENIRQTVETGGAT